MQRCYSRLAGFHRLACLGGQTQRCSLHQQYGLRLEHGTRCFSSPSSLWAIQDRKQKQRNKRTGKVQSAERDQNHPAYLPVSKLPPLTDRRRPDAWVSLLEEVLPIRLRSGLLGGNHRDTSGTEPIVASSSLTPRDVAVMLYHAQRSYNIDVLTYMGVEKGQWKAVVWLVTRIVDNLWKGSPEESTGNVQAKASALWKGQGSLKEMTENEHGIQLDLPTGLQTTPSLDELTIDLSPLHEPLQANFNHDVLGVIWRSLGNMIIADAARKDKPKSTITPEILEMIAWLHHSGMMPSSIYSYQPSDDSSALRQPPTLHLLSSHILTSLTDAAWRAHESLVVEEAKAKGGEYLSMRPEIPGSMYKVHVAGLGHEVWLELVLWSCLHGQWIEEGASILENVTKNDSWSALSWRELASPLIQPGQERSINWDDLRYRLNAGYLYGDPTLTNTAKDKVKRTLSTEIITAFVEALVDTIRTRVGNRGIPTTNVQQYITMFKGFLDRKRLSLGSTSWDAIVLRFFESEGLDVHSEPGLAERIIRLLSSQFGKELSAKNAPDRNEQWQPLPAYALDGTAASLGLMHRVLRSYIEQGNLGGALRTFEELQGMADRNKQKSIQDFFDRQAKEGNDQVSNTDTDVEVNFESRLAGIEYPGFYPQLPGSILAPFLDLITESRSFEFGKWLLHSEDVDGPIITESMYTDPIVGPALVRFASAIEDGQFLVKLLEKQGKVKKDNGDGTKVPESSLLALLQGQVHLRKWDVVDQILATIKEVPGYPLEGQSVAILARAVLRDFNPKDTSIRPTSARPDLERAFTTFMAVASDARALNREVYNRVCTTMMVLACIGPRWEQFMCSFDHTYGNQKYTMTSNAFNVILDGVVNTYGSERGKEFLGKFWRAAWDDRIVDAASEAKQGVVRMPNERPGARHTQSQYSISMTLGKHMTNRKPSRLHGVFTPNATTVNVILRKAFQDYRNTKKTTMDEKEAQDVQWARRLLRLLGLKEQDVDYEIQRVLLPLKSEGLTSKSVV